MSISTKELAMTAFLARLAIDEKKQSIYQKELSTILQLADQLKKIDTETIEPLAHPLEAKQRLRCDKATKDHQHENYQSLAPLSDNGLYLVPKVID